MTSAHDPESASRRVGEQPPTIRRVSRTPSWLAVYSSQACSNPGTFRLRKSTSLSAWSRVTISALVSWRGSRPLTPNMLPGHRFTSPGWQRSAAKTPGAK